MNSMSNFKIMMTGTAKIMPKRPANLPITVSEIIIKRGLTFIHLLMMNGFMKFDSTVWAKTTIPRVKSPKLKDEESPTKTAGTPPI